MIREDRFVLSRNPYAIDLSSLAYQPGDRLARCRAAWFRRRRGGIIACIGTLWDYQREAPPDTATFLRRHIDGRYGGNCEGRWDGDGYWGESNLGIMGEHLEVLRPMLDAYPAIPDGFDGWWRFQSARERWEENGR